MICLKIAVRQQEISAALVLVLGLYLCAAAASLPDILGKNVSVSF